MNISDLEFEKELLLLPEKLNNIIKEFNEWVIEADKDLEYKKNEKIRIIEEKQFQYKYLNEDKFKISEFENIITKFEFKSEIFKELIKELIIKLKKYE